MQKTDRMLLIEERAGKDVREVLSEAYAAKGTIQGAAEWISEEFNTPISFGIVSDWISLLGGTVRKTIEWAAEEAVAA